MCVRPHQTLLLSDLCAVELRPGITSLQAFYSCCSMLFNRKIKHDQTQNPKIMLFFLTCVHVLTKTSILHFFFSIYLPHYFSSLKTSTAHPSACRVSLIETHSLSPLHCHYPTFETPIDKSYPHQAISPPHVVMQEMNFCRERLLHHNRREAYSSKVTHSSTFLLFYSAPTQMFLLCSMLCDTISFYFSDFPLICADFLFFKPMFEITARYRLKTYSCHTLQCKTI